ISAFGIHLKVGLTSGSFFASLMRKRIISSSEKIILLADSSKFGKIEWAHFANIDDIDTIITDSGINNEFIEGIKETGINLIII
ncbi:MAG: DeoR/GlpR family DNA-binding transcription regulator, partial [Spirochaetota bacterium]